MPTSGPMESSLILVVPEAEPAVHAYRARHDLASRVGVPAHITVAYPFKPTAALDSSDLSRLRELFAAAPAFTVELDSTGWFGTDVLFLSPADPGPIVRLARQVEAAFPEYPIYGGAFEDIHPHLTVAHDCGANVLREIDQDLQRAVPITHRVTTVELWSGPALSTRQTGWHLVDRLALSD